MSKMVNKILPRNLRLTCMCVLLIVAAGVSHQVSAREFRSIKSIATPARAGTLPGGAKAVVQLRPVEREIMVKAVNDLTDAWNRRNLRDYLSDRFFDKSRLADAVDNKVPRNSTLRILSVQGIQTLAQYIQPDESGREWVVSTVSVTTKTQLEFNDPAAGFQRREGTNEYIFKVRQRIKK